MMEGFNRLCYIEHNGLRLNPAFDPDAIMSAMNYQHKAGQLFLASYPKCGKTWLQHIIMSILAKGQTNEDDEHSFLNNPSIDVAGAEVVDMMISPGFIKTHLPYNLLRCSPEAKYIYITRNPKDCCVSFYYHTKKMFFYNFQDGTFDEFFEMFINGRTHYGDFFDHLLSWYAHKDDSNVHFLTYERLKKDTRGEIIKLAEFIGEEYHNALMMDPKCIENILEYSSFENLQNRYNPFMDSWLSKKFNPTENIMRISGLKYNQEFRSQFAPSEDTSGIKFIRNGIVGDWKNHFTPEQEDRMNQWIKAKTEGSDVMNLWEDLTV